MRSRASLEKHRTIRYPGLRRRRVDVLVVSFGHATSRSAVHVRILSSTTGLKKSDPGEIAFEAGSHLQEICNTTFSDDSSKPEIRVLGDPPGVHDRFLVIDGNVWFSGNSLNRIGERAGMIVRLLYPEPVVARLEAFWSQAQTLSEWLANHTDREDGTRGRRTSCVIGRSLLRRHMSDRLLPKPGVPQGVPVERLPAPSVGPRLLWPSIRYAERITKTICSD